VYKSIIITLFRLLILGRSAQAKALGNCESNCVDCHTHSPVEAKFILKNFGGEESVKISQIKGLWSQVIETA